MRYDCTLAALFIYLWVEVSESTLVGRERRLLRPHSLLVRSIAALIQVARPAEHDPSILVSFCAWQAMCFVESQAVFHLHPATADLSGCTRQTCLMCSLCLISMPLLVCPTYKILASHVIQYTWGSLRPKLSLRGQRVWMLFFVRMWIVLMCLARSLLLFDVWWQGRNLLWAWLMSWSQAIMCEGLQTPCSFLALSQVVLAPWNKVGKMALPCATWCSYYACRCRSVYVVFLYTWCPSEPSDFFLMKTPRNASLLSFSASIINLLLGWKLCGVCRRVCATC